LKLLTSTITFFKIRKPSKVTLIHERYFLTRKNIDYAKMLISFWGRDESNEKAIAIYFQ